VTQLTHFLSSFYPGQPAFWWVVSSGMLLLLFLLGRRQWRAAHPVVVADADELLQADAWLPPKLTPDERRLSLRRAGMPVHVKVIDPKKPNRQIAGIVFDRSATGLRVALTSSLPIGSTLQIRSDNAHPDSPWVDIIIRNCAKADDCFEHGCQFTEELPLNVLLTFG
jgi:hypothetical protein